MAPQSCYVLQRPVGGPARLERVLPAGQEPPAFDRTVACVFVNALCELVRPAAVLRDCAEVLDVPAPACRVAWAQLPNLGNLCSSKGFLRGNAPQPCVCSLIDEHFKINGHLCTALGNWAQSLPAVRLAVQALHENGLLHVPTQPAVPAALVEEYCRALGPVVVDMGGLDAAEAA